VYKPVRSWSGIRQQKPRSTLLLPSLQQQHSLKTAEGTRSVRRDVKAEKSDGTTGPVACAQRAM